MSKGLSVFDETDETKLVSCNRRNWVPVIDKTDKTKLMRRLCHGSKSEKLAQC